MRNTFALLSMAALLAGCAHQVDPTVKREENEFRGTQVCHIPGNYIQEHNSGSVNFDVIQRKSHGAASYEINIETSGVAHNFPRDSIMLMTLDNNPPVRLEALVSDEKETTQLNYQPGYVVGGTYPYYVPGYTYTTTNRKDLVVFRVQEELIKQMARSKTIKFSVEGRQNLEGTFVKDNFVALNNLVSECVYGRSPLKPN